MNQALIWLTFRQIHWMRFLFLTILFLAGYYEFTNSGNISSASESIMFVWVLGAGVIGRDVWNGVLQSVFSRPVKRSEYVLSKWFGVGLMASMAAWLYVGMGWVTLWAHDMTPSSTDILNSLALAALGCFGAAAPLVFLSSLVPSLGDLGLMFSIWIIPSVTIGLLPVAYQYWGYRVADAAQDFLFPSKSWAEEGFDMVSYFAWAGYFLTIALCLTLAIWKMNRKEITYANS